MAGFSIKSMKKTINTGFLGALLATSSFFGIACGGGGSGGSSGVTQSGGQIQTQTTILGDGIALQVNPNMPAAEIINPDHPVISKNKTWEKFIVFGDINELPVPIVITSGTENNPARVTDMVYDPVDNNIKSIAAWRNGRTSIIVSSASKYVRDVLASLPAQNTDAVLRETLFLHNFAEGTVAEAVAAYALHKNQNASSGQPAADVMVEVPLSIKVGEATRSTIGGQIVWTVTTPPQDLSPQSNRIIAAKEVLDNVRSDKSRVTMCAALQVSYDSSTGAAGQRDLLDPTGTPTGLTTAGWPYMPEMITKAMPIAAQVPLNQGGAGYPSDQFYDVPILASNTADPINTTIVGGSHAPVGLRLTSTNGGESAVGEPIKVAIDLLAPELLENTAAVAAKIFPALMNNPAYPVSFTDGYIAYISVRSINTAQIGFDPNDLDFEYAGTPRKFPISSATSSELLDVLARPQHQRNWMKHIGSGILFGGNIYSQALWHIERDGTSSYYPWYVDAAQQGSPARAKEALGAERGGRQ